MKGIKRRPSFSPRELLIGDHKPGFMGMGPETPLFSTPVSYRENLNAHYFSKEPWFAATFADTDGITSTEYNEKLSD